MNLWNLLERLRCSHQWKEIGKFNVIQYPGPFSASFDVGGTVVGHKIRYRCEKCKSEKTIKGD